MDKRYLEMPKSKDSVQYAVWASGLAKDNKSFDMWVDAVWEFGLEILQYAQPNS